MHPKRPIRILTYPKESAIKNWGRTYIKYIGKYKYLISDKLVIWNKANMIALKKKYIEKYFCLSAWVIDSLKMNRLNKRKIKPTSIILI